MYQEEDFLQLSGIQHFAFCRRQWALIHIELQWQENLRTIEGQLLHEKAHDASIAEARGDLIITRAMPIHSRELGLSGECDIVEFQRSKAGIAIFNRAGLFQVVPVEYKRGVAKASDIDILQLTAQMLCLEEMLCCTIPFGYLFYGETNRRLKVDFDDAIRQKTKATVLEMHGYYDRRYTPKAKRSKACNACSLQSICLPSLEKKQAVAKYIAKKLSQEAEK